VLNEYWPRLTGERPDFQFHLIGNDDEILARARSIPLRWDGTLEDLPAGIDGAIARGFDEGGANVLCALVTSDQLDWQGTGLLDFAEIRELAGNPEDAAALADRAARLFERKGNVVSALRARQLGERLRSSPAVPMRDY
jgi:hypothetical protein